MLFDLDDTLLVDEPHVGTCLRSVTAEVDEAVGADAGTVAASVRAAAREVWRASPLAGEARRLGFSSWEGLAANFVGGHPVVEPFRKWVPTFRRDSWATGLEPFNATDRGPELSERYRRERRSAYRLFPEALEVLSQFRAAGWLLGIVTNGPPDLQREKVQATGLNEYVDMVAVSGEVGAGKPQPAIFEFVLGHLDVPPSAAVMVGDSIERDMKGAQHLGMRTIWRPSPGRATEWRPALGSLRDLFNLLHIV